MPDLVQSAYACVHDAKGDFILARKLQVGYFFGDGTKGGLRPKGQKITNGGGKWCLPGGGAAWQADVAASARAEWTQECRASLDAVSVVTRTWKDGKHSYGTAYFKVANIYEVLEDVMKCLAWAAVARDAVQKKVVKDYKEMRAKYPDGPYDDELDTATVWNVVTDWSTISTWADDESLGWFYVILENLKTALKPSPT